VTTEEFQRARSPEQQEQRRATILAAARDMLGRLPPAEVSLRELSRQVGLSKSNVVRYFPTREAVFLAVLIEDWDSWLSDVEAALPPADPHQRPHARHELVAAAIAETLTAHRRFCDLLVACQTVLEHNVPEETARAFKTASLIRLNRLASLVQSRVPALGDTESFEFAGLVWVTVAGAWPMAHPAPVVAAVLAEPQLAPLRVDFPFVARRMLTVSLDGLDRSPR
jgi:AcrR family transcriptional regulator